ncbi:MAG: FAD-binding oxidoreductase [Burkholderiaceae bacterium]|nr:FAD-binding oxidoreductase [Burkholderiaceae bacterium]
MDKHSFNPGRRSLLAAALAEAGLLATLPAPLLAAPAKLTSDGERTPLVANITGLYTVPVARIEQPRSTEAVAAQVRAWPGTVAVGGGRYSMGGQIACVGGLHLDLRGLNRLVWLDAAAKRVRVQAGMVWRDLQDLLDPLGLAVKTMQSYANFTVGGSVSVNVHGRYVGHGPIGHTVRALQLVLADGTVVEASPQRRAELFRAAIGGYGAVGVISEVELELADNCRIASQVQEVALDDYVAHVEQQVLADPTAVLHNADLLPPRFDAPVAITWRRVADDEPLTEAARLVPRGQRYALERQAIWAVTELPGGTALGSRVLHPLLKRGREVAWLNHEASLDVASLEPRSRSQSTFALQEYFVPGPAVAAFARGLSRILQQRRAQVLNISVRHSPADRVALLPWAREAVFSFVLYHKQRTSPQAQAEVGRWTRELIDLVLEHGGRWYLPYQPHATRAQFDRAYPEAQALRALKRRVDPDGRFGNELWRKYL